MAKILLVEDNDINREMLSRRLVRKGFDVVMAVDGLQGVAMAAIERPDLILMDMSLPGIDGWEATRRIKADTLTQGIPVVALTAHAMSDDRAKALAAGCNDFDTKPVDLARLLGKMGSLLDAGAVAGAAAGTGTNQRPLPGASNAAHQPVTNADVTLPAVPASLPGFKTELEHFCMQAGISTAVQEDLQVVLDEVCANVFKHAYEPTQPGALRLGLRLNHSPPPATLEVTFSDQGRPFDPLSRTTPDLSLSWEEKPVGGLGIHLIQTLTDRQSYRYTPAEGNQLSLVKHLT